MENIYETSEFCMNDSACGACLTGQFNSLVSCRSHLSQRAIVIFIEQTAVLS